MTMFLSVRALHEERVPKKTIARRLGVDVRTVRAYIRRIAHGASEPRRASVPKKLDRFVDRIEAKVGQGLSAVQIFQDLSEDPLFDACYDTVKRAVRKLRHDEPEVYCRMRFAPGEEAQIDFGDIGVLDVDGQRRRVWLFAMTLCFSRHSYYELVLDQTVPTFLGAIRRGFEHFGGVPARLKPDNLKSGVLLSALGERHYQEDFFRFCRHYGCVPDAARPATPTDKGRTERDIGYVKGGCFRGRSFASFDEAVAWLARWHREIASVRVHGTTRRRPIDLFDEAERAALQPLPSEPYEIAAFTRHKVRKDCHVQVQANDYSVPFTLVGQTVSVRRTEQRIDVFAQGERVASHARALGQGKDVTDVAHYPPTKRLGSHEIHRLRVERVRSAGPHTQSYLGRLREGPWVFGDQVARLAKLVERFGAAALEKACARALHFGALDGARRIETILERGLHEHELVPLAAASHEGRDFGRALREYDLALFGCKEAS
ncbi:MAG: IS21 family transposase [Planctomycetes bacterium]|nr:IS21 family transposase [Planctomycetota bacterium]